MCLAGGCSTPPTMACRNYARVYLANKHEFVSTDISTPVGAITHKVEWKGPQRKHVVVRVADGAVIQEGIAEKHAANTWLENYLKATTATA